MDDKTTEFLRRIAEALERMAPRSRLGDPLPEGENCFLWQGRERRLAPIHSAALPLSLFCGVEEQKRRLRENSEYFARGLAAHHVLLWGARGSGKSSLVRAAHADVAGRHSALNLVGISQEDLHGLPLLLNRLRDEPRRRFILFCDDLSFLPGDDGYRALKIILDGGLGEVSENCLFYATSNRRHLLPREASENERGTALRPEETVEDHVSLSDRFGLSLGFHPIDEDTYLAIVDAYLRHFGLVVDSPSINDEAALYARERGGRSGRAAWQFIRDYAARTHQSLKSP